MRALPITLSILVALALMAGTTFLRHGEAVTPAAAADDDKRAKKLAKKKAKKKAIKAKAKGAGDGTTTAAAGTGTAPADAADDDDIIEDADTYMDDDDDDAPPPADKKDDKSDKSKLPPPPAPGGTTVPDLPDISGGIGVVVDVPGEGKKKKKKKKGDTIGSLSGSSGGGGGGGFKVSYIGYAVAGLGVVGFVMGPVFGALAKGKASELEDSGCPPMDSSCPFFNDGTGTGGAEVLAAGRRFNTISIVSYIGGGALLGTGIALVVVDVAGGGGSADAGSRFARASLVPVIGPGVYGASARLEF